MKWIGACVAAAACVALGLSAASSLGRRAKVLDELLRALRLLSRRILLLREPLQEAVWALREDSSLFAEAARGEGGDPIEAFSQALGKMRELTGQERTAALALLTDCGGSGMDEQEAILTEGLERLGETLKAAQEKARKDGNLYRTLGLIAGAAVLIMSW